MTVHNLHRDCYHCLGSGRVFDGLMVRLFLKERSIPFLTAANAIGISQPHMSDLLCGRRKFTHQLSRKLSEYLQSLPPAHSADP